MHNTTVLIVAKNAENTIRQAINSAIYGNPEQKVLLVDDFSDDNTVEQSESIKHPNLTIVQPRLM